MATVSVKQEIEIDMGLYSLVDAGGTCIADYASFRLDDDNDILIETENHYFIDEEEFALLEKAKELSQDDWDIISTQRLLTSE